MVIKILSSEISNQIAAGEVVERPASVVKELVENSIDAGATEMEIFIENGGKRLIKVVDNGQGLSKEDLEKAPLRHATSKINSVDDLFTIQSFGFRGEALAAMSSVSDFTMISKQRSFDKAYQIKIKAGEAEALEIASHNTGTTVAIKDLFYPTPARLQYLKNEATEYKNILKEIYGFALSHFDVGFKVYKDEKLTLDYPADVDFESRVKRVLKKFHSDLIPVAQEFRGFKVSGFICVPGAGVANKNNQYLLVNNRRIEDHRLAFAVREGYVQSAGIEKHLHPVFVLKIDIDPILVDVNVHPRKLEVKFAEPGEVFMGIKQAVIKSLEVISSIEGVSRELGSFAPSFLSQTSLPPRSNNQSAFSLLKSNLSFSDRNLERNTNIDIPVDDLNESLVEAVDTNSELLVIGQVDNKYILAQGTNGVYFFDQHALHERQRFEQFWKEYKAQDIHSQDLLIPQTLTFSEEEIILLAESKKVLENLGVKLLFPTDTTIEVLAMPLLLSEEPLEQVFEKMIKFFEEDQVGQNVLDQLMRKLLEYKSCRGAVMFGDKLDRAEMEKLILDFDRTDWKLLCPHGRPNHWFIPFSDLDKKFHR